MKLMLLFNTLKYLKLVQIFYRIKKNIYTVKYDPNGKAIKRRDLNKNINFIFKKSTFNFQTKDFTILNLTKSFKYFEWNFSDFPYLWRYNFYYFNFINSKEGIGNETFIHKFLIDWIDNDPYQVSMEPYPCSLRIVNLIKWSINNSINDKKIIRSIANQSRCLFKNLEYHLLGNHLIANAKALIFAGIFFDDHESDKWFEKGSKILIQEIPEQILSDGGYFELTTMYHNIVLEDLLDLYEIASKYKAKDKSTVLLDILNQNIQKMLDWSRLMRHHDGEIPFFNDSCIGISESFDNLLKFTNRLGIKTNLENSSKKYKEIEFHNLNKSGFIKVKTSNYLTILDIGDIGPEYLPGHAHADSLSFELSTLEGRVFVNGGTSTYENGPLRLTERSTSNHNTLELNNMNSSEVWSSFRVANRAKTFNKNILDGENYCFVEGEHDGYKRLRNKPIHYRGWKCYKDKLVIRDHIKYINSKNSHYLAKIKFILHPDVLVKKIHDNSYQLFIKNKKIIFNVNNNISYLEDIYYGVEFNKRIKSKAICVQTNYKSKVEIKF